MRDRGVEFLYVLEEYYDNLLERVGDIDEEIETLKEQVFLLIAMRKAIYYNCLPRPL